MEYGEEGWNRTKEKEENNGTVENLKIKRKGISD